MITQRNDYRIGPKKNRFDHDILEDNKRILKLYKALYSTLERKFTVTWDMEKQVLVMLQKIFNAFQSR